jgi:nucleotide-binding universal stress UspA family protein
MVRAVHAWCYPALTYAHGLVPPPTFAREGFEDEARAIVETALSTLDQVHAVSIEPVVAQGGATSVLVEQSRSADLLVVGHRGRGGFLALSLGSVALQCAQHAACPVVVVRPAGQSTSFEHRRRVVVGVDGSEPARRALLWAADEARRRDAALEIVYCWHPGTGLALGLPALAPDRESLEASAHAVVAAAVRAVEGRSPHAEAILVDAPAAATLVGASAGADLVVVGTRGHGGFPGLLLGSVSTHVVHHARCPAVIVH